MSWRVVAKWTRFCAANRPGCVKLAFGIAATLSAILCVWHLEAHGIDSSVSFAVVWVALFPISAILFLIGKWKESALWKSIGAGVLLANVLACSAGGALGKWQRKATIQVGNQVCLALEEYNQKHGEYPQSLQHLIPDYVENVPLSRMAVLREREFGYRRVGGDFRLSFSCPSWISCSRGKNGPWECYD